MGSFFLLASRQSSAKVASPKATEVAQQFTASVAPKAFIRATYPTSLIKSPFIHIIHNVPNVSISVNYEVDVRFG